MKGLAAVLGVAALIVVVGACGSDEPDAGSGRVEIAQALAAAEGSEVTIRGHLVADGDGNARLCSLLAESFPPQCGGDAINLLGFDASSVPGSKTPEMPSEIQTARWTDSYITVKGIKAIDGLADVRLVAEASTTRQGPGGPDPTAPSLQSSPTVSHGGPVNDYVGLVDRLRAAGAATEPAGNVSQPFFAPEGQILTVNGGGVQVFEFAGADEADAVAETVSADGGSIGTSMVGWVAPAHFFKAGKLIVIYVGRDGDVISALEEAMGPRFAGGGDRELDQPATTLGTPLRLKVGQSELVGPQGLRVAFVEVVEDSRCPRDVTCIQAGRARILIEVSSPGDVLGFGTPELTLGVGGADPKSNTVAGALDKYLFELDALDPYPQSAGQEPPDYTATLVVTQVERVP